MSLKLTPEIRLFMPSRLTGRVLKVGKSSDTVLIPRKHVFCYCISWKEKEKVTEQKNKGDRAKDKLIFYQLISTAVALIHPGGAVTPHGTF